MNEFSRMIDRRGLGEAPLQLAASAEECAALARRFGLVAIERLEADISLVPENDAIDATGRLRAAIIQSCAVSGEDLPATIDEPVRLRFVPQAAATVPDAEIELDAEDLDEIEYAGTSFDLGEALAQSLALAIDPFATGPQAECARQAAGLAGDAPSGPFAALKSLKGKPA